MNTNTALKKGKKSTLLFNPKTKMDIKKWISGLTAFTLALGVSLNIQVQNAEAAESECDMNDSTCSVSTDSKILASDGAADDQFGQQVDIYEDWAVVSAYVDDIGANTDQGSVYVFKYNSTTDSWSQHQKLTASDGAADDWFGIGFEISADRIVVGSAFDDNANGNDAGSFYVFDYNSGTDTWSESQKLIASDGAAGDRFGWVVSISGNTISAGAWYDDIGANANQGSAYIFDYNGSTWSESQKLTASDGAAGDSFGWKVIIDGTRLVVAAWYDDIGANANQGSVYVFDYNGSTWSESQKLTASDGTTNDYFGTWLDIDGNFIVSGSYLADIGANTDQGAAYVYYYNGSTWSESQKLTASDGAAGDNFGVPVDIEGDRIAITGREHDGGKGAVYIYDNNGSSWSQSQKLMSSDGASGDWFGGNIGIYQNKLIIGSRYDDDNGDNSGSAYIVKLKSSPEVISGEQDWSAESTTEATLSGSSGEILLDSGAETLTFNSTQTMNLSNGVVSGGESETHNGTTVASALTTLKGSGVSAAKKTLLQSGTNGVDITLQTTGTTAASVLIPDDTTVYSEDTWDGIFSPPIDTSASIIIPQKNVYSGVKVGSDTASFVMDKAARVSLGSVTGDPMYKDGTGTWIEISACSDATVSSAGSLAFPNECYIEDSGTTYIWTYHFTEFGDAGDPTDTAVSLEVTPGSVTISAPTTIDFGSLPTSTSSTVQSVDLESGSDYFSIEDLASEDTGYYITLSAGDLTDGGNTIASTNFTINLEGRSVTTFSTDPSGAPVIPSALLDPGSGDNAINGLTILERTSSVNGVIGEYGIQPLFKLTVPAYTALGSYTGTFTMTLM